MRSLRLSELYTSVQCEGPRVGLPTQFVRFAGCNMRCPGWPCDTQHAIDPAIFMAEGGSTRYQGNGLVAVVAPWPMRVCLTGGEPFLQPEAELHQFCDVLWKAGYSIECFTNGSFEFPPWARQRLQFMMDWKLEGSGEANTNRDVREKNAASLKMGDGLKFVVATEADLHEAKAVYLELVQKYHMHCTFWVGSAWDQVSTAEIVDFMTRERLDWRLNVQVHKFIWPADERGV